MPLLSTEARGAAFVAALSVTVLLGATARGVTNLATNPGFEDLDAVDGPGDGWSSFGAAGFNAFFGADNAHASLFADQPANIGSVFQLGIPAVAGATYQFDLLDTRIEENFDANLTFGVEFYAADDTTLLTASTTTIDAAERLANATGGVNGAVFSTTGTAPVGASFVRPIVAFDTVASTAASQENLFIFNSFLSEVPAPGGELLKNPGFGENFNLDAFPNGDGWGSFGNVSIEPIFGDNVSANLFADTALNEGTVFQQSILADESATYEFSLVDVRIEENFDADLFFGLEYYGTDDFTKLGEDLVQVDTTTTGDGLSFSMQASPVAGSVYVRPVISFDNVPLTFLAEDQANAFVFETSLVEVVVGGVPGDTDGDGDVDLGDLDTLATNFGGTPPLVGGASIGDFNGDGDVDLGDLDTLATNFGTGTATAVPEPTAAALLVAAGLFLGRNRR